MVRVVLVFSVLLASTIAVNSDSSAPDASDRIRRVEATIADRMRHYGIPNVSIAVINEGKVEWARGYGVVDAGSKQPVTVETLFQACSLLIYILVEVQFVFFN